MLLGIMLACFLAGDRIETGSLIQDALLKLVLIALAWLVILWSMPQREKAIIMLRKRLIQRRFIKEKN